MRLLLLTIALLSMVSLRALQPLDAPIPYCVVVETSGDITITWSQVADPFNLFDRYEVYHSPSNVLVATSPGIANTTTTFSGFNGQTGAHIFYVRAISDGSGPYDSPNSTTIRSIKLNVNNPSDGTATLTWNAPFTVPPTGTSGKYYIHRQIDGAPFELIDSLNYGSQFYKDTIYACSAQVNYRITLPHNSGCSSISSVDGDLFLDVLPPYTPQFSWVTVDTTTGHAQLQWQQNQAEDTYGYIILQFTPGTGWIIVDTVYGIGNTSYYALANGASSNSEMYAVAAIDDCLRGTPPSYNTSPAGTEHNTVHLKASVFLCEKRITITFNPYISWPDLTEYELYIKSGGAAWNLLTTLPPGTTTYTVQALNQGVVYQFIVKAKNGRGFSSLSNLISVSLDQPPQPDFLYLQTATVTFDETVDLRVHVDVLAGLQGIRIERAIDALGPFVPVANKQVLSNPVELVDASAAVQLRPWFYRAIAIDSCGNESVASNTLKTILLTAELNQMELTAALNWNAFEGWGGLITGYHIYRFVPDAAPVKVAEVSPFAESYTDYLGDAFYAHGKIYYYVTAIEGTNSFGFSDSAASNVALVKVEPLIWIPNAFTPNGINPEFKPVIGFIDPTDYLLLIYNRWGEIIFQSETPSLGWNGDTSSGGAPMDVYVYKVFFKSSDGETHQRTGSITLIR